MINIDFRHQLIEINKKTKVVTSTGIEDFPIEIDNDFLSITIDSHRLLSILLIDNNRKIIFLGLDFRY